MSPKGREELQRRREAMIDRGMNDAIGGSTTGERRARMDTRRALMGKAGRLLAGGVTLGLLAACGGSTGTTGSGEGAAPSGKVAELRVHGQGTSDGEGYDKNVAAFNQQYA